ncbi:MAG: metal ABC transporter permease [Bifidobacteriaceae bacterium]|nr:metal ABC transporter permease [Bifidobacteriaceae bacterium]
MKFAYNEDWLALFTEDFMLFALLAGVMVAVLAGAIGYAVVIRNSTFAAHSIAHIGIPGGTLAVLLGIPVTLGFGAFCLLGALLIGVFSARFRDREIATGTILAFSMGLGLLFANISSKANSSFQAVLFGSLLAVDFQNLITIAVVLVLSILTLAIIYRPLLFASIDDKVARSKGVNTQFIAIIFNILLSLVVTIAVQVVGALLIFALLITPAATAIELSSRPFRSMLLSIGFAVTSVFLGLMLSCMFEFPPSFAIVLFTTFFWLTAKLAVRRRKHVRLVDGHH